MPSAIQPEALQKYSPGKTVVPLKHKNGVTSAAMWSILFFIILNASFSLSARPEKPNSHNSTDDAKEMWKGTKALEITLHGLNSLTHRPNVVILGSSLMMHPFWALDYSISKSVSDLFHHHHSIALERALKSSSIANPCVYSLALFGQMTSDAYLNVNELLKDTKKPDWLILGIAPRDFYDFEAQGPMSTVTFKKLVGLYNFTSYADAFLPTWQDKADFLVSHACFLYGKRWRFQREIDKAVDKVSMVAHLKRSDAAPIILQLHEHSGFSLAIDAEERWANSIIEYKRRYKNIGEKDLSLQFQFLGKLLNICSDRGIKVVLINMPLTEENRSLLPAGFYPSYRNSIKVIATRPGVTYMDFGDSAQFVKSDFWDTAHLNHCGGKKIVARLIPVLANSSK